ncbi:MAG: universal stress protein [Halobacteriaceae archaeon]
MYDHILFPTDGSESAAAVADHVDALVDRTGATVHVLSVVDARNRFESPTGGVAPEAWDEAERERAEAAIDDAVAALAAGTSVERHVEIGIPHAKIVEYASREDCDVVVMSTHGRTGLDHYLIGSVAERVVRQSPVPVLTVRLED